METKIKVLYICAEGNILHYYIDKPSGTNVIRGQGDTFYDVMVNDGIMDLTSYTFEEGKLTKLTDDWFMSGERKYKYHVDEVVYSTPMERHILRKFAWTVDGSNILITREWGTRNEYYQPFRRTGRKLYHVSDLVYCEDIGDYALEDDASGFNDDDELFYFHTPRLYDYNCLRNYHGTVNNTKVLMEESKSRVGYEVEKNYFEVPNADGTATTRVGMRESGYFCGDFDIFRGYEYDGSCGVEAITNILPLDEEHFTYVEELMTKAVTIIDAPSDARCGGHATMSYQGIKGAVLLDKMRYNLSIIYGMFPGRLNNHYCNSNKKLRVRRGRGVVAIKDECVELRLPPAIKNVADLLNRHKIFSVIMDHSVNSGEYDALIPRIRPLLMERYDNDKDKVESVIEMSNSFNKWLSTDVVDTEIYQYIKDEVSREERARLRAAEIEAITDIVRAAAIARKVIKINRYFMINYGGSKRRVTLTSTGFHLNSMCYQLTMSIEEIILTCNVRTEDGLRLSFHSDTGTIYVKDLDRDNVTINIARPVSMNHLNIENEARRGLCNIICIGGKYYSHKTGDIITSTYLENPWERANLTTLTSQWSEKLLKQVVVKRTGSVNRDCEYDLASAEAIYIKTDEIIKLHYSHRGNMIETSRLATLLEKEPTFVVVHRNNNHSSGVVLDSNDNLVCSFKGWVSYEYSTSLDRIIASYKERIKNQLNTIQ